VPLLLGNNLEGILDFEKLIIFIILLITTNKEVAKC